MLYLRSGLTMEPDFPQSLLNAATTVPADEPDEPAEPDELDQPEA